MLQVCSNLAQNRNRYAREQRVKVVLVEKQVPDKDTHGCVFSVGAWSKFLRIPNILLKPAPQSLGISYIP